MLTALTNPPDPPDFRTSDYGTSGFLMALGFEADRIERNGSQVIFCFPRSPALFSALEAWTSNALVPCRDHFHGLRKAKGIIQHTIQGKYDEYHAK
jgi:hypothetical protein